MILVNSCCCCQPGTSKPDSGTLFYWYVAMVQGPACVQLCSDQQSNSLLCWFHHQSWWEHECRLFPVTWQLSRYLNPLLLCRCSFTSSQQVTPRPSSSADAELRNLQPVHMAFNCTGIVTQPLLLIPDCTAASSASDQGSSRGTMVRMRGTFT